MHARFRVPLPPLLCLSKQWLQTLQSSVVVEGVLAAAGVHRDYSLRSAVSLLTAERRAVASLISYVSSPSPKRATQRTRTRRRAASEHRRHATRAGARAAPSSSSPVAAPDACKSTRPMRGEDGQRAVVDRASRRHRACRTKGRASLQGTSRVGREPDATAVDEAAVSTAHAHAQSPPSLLPQRTAAPWPQLLGRTPRSLVRRSATAGRRHRQLTERRRRPPGPSRTDFADEAVRRSV